MLIQTDRTIIKHPTLKDLNNLLILSADEDIARQNFNTRGKVPKEAVEGLLKDVIRRNSEKNDLYFFAGIYTKNKHDELIGFITNKEAGPGDCFFLGGLNYELSYALRNDFRNKGIMTEAIIAITNFMRMKTVNIVAALVKPGNIQSEKALHKAGFDIAMITPVGTAFVKRLEMTLKKYVTIFQRNGLPKNEAQEKILNQAIRLTNNEDYYNVIQLLENLLKENDNLIDANTYLAFSKFMTGDNQKAEYYFNKAIAINKYDFRVYYHRGMIYDQLREYDKALLDYSMAIELNDEFTDIYFNRAIIYIDTGDREKAMLDIQRLEELGDPQVSQLLMRLRNPFRSRFGF